MSSVPDNMVVVAWTSKRNRAGRRLDRIARNVTMQGVDIPAGFECDGYSIRKVASLFVTDYMQGREAAVLHDYLYENADTMEFSRRQADRMFRDELEQRGVGRYSRWVMYWAVRATGWRSWGRRG